MEIRGQGAIFSEISNYSSYYGTLFVVAAANFSFILEQQLHKGSQSVIVIVSIASQLQNALHRWATRQEGQQRAAVIRKQYNRWKQTARAAKRGSDPKDERRQAVIVTSLHHQEAKLSNRFN